MVWQKCDRQDDQMETEALTLFKKACAQAMARKNSRLLRLIKQEYKQLIDEEFGCGTFAKFEECQRMIEEYQAFSPRVEFYTHHGFVFPRVIIEKESFGERLRRQILQEGIEKEGAFALRERILHSKARQKIRSKYGLALALLRGNVGLSGYGLCDTPEPFAKGDAAEKVLAQLLVAREQNDKDQLTLVGEFFPDVYKAFSFLCLMESGKMSTVVSRK